MILIPIPLDQFKELIREEVQGAMKEHSPAPSQDEDEFLTSKQVGKLINVSGMTLYNWRKAGLIPFTRIRRKLLFCKRDLIEALKAIGKQSLANRLAA